MSHMALSFRFVDGERPTRQLPGEAYLLRLQSRVPKGRDDDEPVAVPLRAIRSPRPDRRTPVRAPAGVGQSRREACLRLPETLHPLDRARLRGEFAVPRSSCGG
jgi:hypothetical protein